MDRVKKLITSLNLSPHPEGGYFREVYRSKGTISIASLPFSISGERNYATSIYFLLTSNMFSAFHRIKQDEIWNYHEGSAIELHVISGDGKYSKLILGTEIDKNETPQVVIPANHWFAAKVINPDSYSLVGCSVSPGFDFRDFELGERSKLILKFPMYKKLIEEFTRVE